jgi:hypothetical protein
MPRIRQTTIADAIERARKMVGAAIHYQLKDKNGGRNPDAPDPASHWINDHGDRVATCDCAGFVAWCLGFDRYQPGTFEYWDGWINTDSAIFEAENNGEWFERLAAPELGCLIVYPSHGKAPNRLIGHVGIVVAVPENARIRVIHCSSGNDRRTGHAIQETDDAAWRDAADKPPKRTRFLRYLKAA